MPVRTRRPIGRFRHEPFGGGSSGSEFSGRASVNMRGLDNIEKALAGPALASVVEQVLQQVYDRSQELVHVDTGALKASGYVRVSHEGGKASGEVGYTANHAAPEEFRDGSHAYLRPAWDEVITFGDGKQQMAEGVAELFGKFAGE